MTDALYRGFEIGVWVLGNTTKVVPLPAMYGLVLGDAKTCLTLEMFERIARFVKGFIQAKLQNP